MDALSQRPDTFMDATGAAPHRSVRAARPFAMILLIVASLAAAAHTASSQVPADLAPGDTLREIRLVDGSTLFGRIVAVDEAGRLTIETTAGMRVEVPRAQIRSLRPVRGAVRHGELWPEDPNTTRLFFAPTGRMLPAGAGYAGVFELFFPFVSLGVTDFFTVSGGTPVIPEVIGRVVYLAPKVGVELSPRVQAAGGVLAFFDLTDGTSESAGIVYGAGTFGTPDDALTVGAGWPFLGDDLAQRPVILLGGEARVGRRLKLITENYLITWREDSYRPDASPRRTTRTVGLFSGGVRVIGDRLSADAGLGFFAGEGESGCCLPLVNFVYSFGGR